MTFPSHLAWCKNRLYNFSLAWTMSVFDLPATVIHTQQHISTWNTFVHWHNIANTISNDTNVRTTITYTLTCMNDFVTDDAHSCISNEWWRLWYTHLWILVLPEHAAYHFDAVSYAWQWWHEHVTLIRMREKLSVDDISRSRIATNIVRTNSLELRFDSTSLA